MYHPSLLYPLSVIMTSMDRKWLRKQADISSSYFASGTIFNHNTFVKLINVEKDQSEIRVFCELEFLHFRITEAAPEDEDRIVGGHEVSPPHKYPFQVKKVHLKLSNENTYIPGVFCFWTLCLRWFRFKKFISCQLTFFFQLSMYYLSSRQTSHSDSCPLCLWSRDWELTGRYRHSDSSLRPRFYFIE